MTREIRARGWLFQGDPTSNYSKKKKIKIGNFTKKKKVFPQQLTDCQSLSGNKIPTIQRTAEALPAAADRRPVFSAVRFCKL